MSGEKCTSRPLLVERAYSIHLNRVDRDFSTTLQVANLLKDLFHISIIEFHAIAKKSNIILTKCLQLYPRFIRKAANFSLDVIIDKHSHEKCVIGALELINSDVLKKKICYDWRLLSKFMNTICNSEGHDDHEVQLKLIEVFVAYFSATHLFYIKTPKTGITSRDIFIESNNNRNMTCYLDLMASLISIANTAH